MPDLTSEAWTQIRYDYEHTDRPVEDICAEHGVSSGTLRDRMRRWQWKRRRAPIPREGPPALAAHELASPPPVRAANGGEGSGVGGLCAAQTAEPSPPTPLRLACASRSDPPHRFAGGGMTYAAPLRNASEMDEGRHSEEESGAAVPHVASGAILETDAAAIVPRLQSAVARVLPAIEATIARLAAGPHHPREMEQAGRALGTLTRTLRELNALLSQHQVRAAADDDMPEDIDAFRNELARRIEAFVESRADEGDTEKQEA